VGSHGTKGGNPEPTPAHPLWPPGGVGIRTAAECRWNGTPPDAACLRTPPGQGVPPKPPRRASQRGHRSQRISPCEQGRRLGSPGPDALPRWIPLGRSRGFTSRHRSPPDLPSSRDSTVPRPSQPAQPCLRGSAGNRQRCALPAGTRCLPRSLDGRHRPWRRWPGRNVALQLSGWRNYVPIPPPHIREACAHRGRVIGEGAAVGGF